MNAFDFHKYHVSAREEALREIARRLKVGYTNNLVEACLSVGINPKSLSNKEIDFIKEIVG